MAKNSSLRQTASSRGNLWKLTTHLHYLYCFAGFYCFLCFVETEKLQAEVPVHYDNSTSPCPSNATANDIRKSCKPANDTEFRSSSERQNLTNKMDESDEVNPNCSQLNESTFSRSYELQEVANLFTDVTDDKHTRSKDEMALVLTLYLQSIQTAVYRVANKQTTGGKQKIKTSFMAIETLTIKGGCEETEVFTLSAGTEAMRTDCITITGQGSGGAAAFISYNNVGLIMGNMFISKKNLKTDEELSKFYLNSKVVSGTIGPLKTRLLDAPVNFTFKHIQAKNTSEKPLCVYWHRMSWTNDGCHIVFYNMSHTICSCSHLSSFAVLMASTVMKEDPVLTRITHVGLSLSLLCLLLSILTFLRCKSIQNTSTFLHLQLSSCLFLADLLFLTGMEQTRHQVLCSVVAGLLHYLYLASFAWMLLEGLHLFLTVRNLKVVNYTSARRLTGRWLCPFGYGVPSGIVAVSAAVNPRGYGTPLHCWLNLKRGFVWSFIGPVSVIILINITFYLIILWTLRERLSSLNKEVSTIQNTRLLTFKAMAQLFLLGCSWGLGFFLVDPVKEPFRSISAYAFTTTNALQGVYVFVVHCLLSRQVQEEYKKYFTTLKKIETGIYVLSDFTANKHMGKTTREL